MLTLFLRSILIFSVAMWPLKGPSAQVEIRKSQLPLPADTAAYEYIRVLVLEKTAAFKLNVPQSYKVIDAAGKMLFQGSQITEMSVSREGALFVLGKQKFQTPFMRIETQGNLQVNGKSYAESLVFLLNPETGLDVVNETLLERYLKGVLPKEVSPGWPVETLKAQAVASRTYAFFRMLERGAETYDVASDVTSQVFGGEDALDPRTNAAVDATRGMILTYQGRVFPAFFHSNSGGYTAQADSVWDIEPHPALKGVESAFSLNEKNAAWHGDFSYLEIEKGLRKHGVAVKGVRQVKFTDLDASGRYRSVIVYDSQGKIKMKSSEFRLALDPFRFRSTLITSLTEGATGITVRGKGWGHGVGLCQYGSKNLGGLGYDFVSILKYYYPFTNITILKAR